jgi:hypothetical protein
MKSLFGSVIFVLSATLAGCGSGSDDVNFGDPPVTGDAAATAVESDSGNAPNLHAAPVVESDVGTNVPADDATPVAQSDAGTGANPADAAPAVQEAAAFTIVTCTPNAKADCACANGGAGKKVCAAAGDSYGLCVPVSDVVVTADAGISTDSGIEKPKTLCVAGETKVCACVGQGPVGAQECAPDGMSLLDCRCPSVGTGGSTGTGPVTGGGGSTAVVTATACVPNETNACACVGLGMVGAQQCATDGTKFNTCQCPSNGTGGSSGAGGSSGSSGSGGSTVGSGGSSGAGGSTVGTGGSSGTGGTTVVPPATATYDIVITGATSFSGFSFTHLSKDLSTYYYPGQTCTGSDRARTCSITVDPTISWEFYAKTGYTGPGSWTPGIDGITGKCTAYVSVTVKNGSKDVAFRMVSDGAGGCHYRIDANAAVVGLGDPNADSDGDSVLNKDDCIAENPSIRPLLSNELPSEICSDGLDNDCSNGDKPCDTGTGGAGGAGGTGGSSGSSGAGGTGGFGGTGGTTVVSNTKTITFEVFDGPSWSSPLTMWSYAPTYSYVSCNSMQMPDPRDGVQRSAAVCEMVVDRAQVLEFQVQVGSMWATGYDSTFTCQKFLRVYAFDGAYAVADYDNDPNTYPDPQYAGRHIWDKFLGSTCHLFLPVAP